jgi:hypothetical protein
MRLTRIFALSPVQVLRARDPATSRQRPTAVGRRLGIVQATGLAVVINPRGSPLVKWAGQGLNL